MKQAGAKNFFKRNIYYFVLGFCVLVVAGIVAAAIFLPPPEDTGEKPKSSTSTSTTTTTTASSSVDVGSGGDDPSEGEVPVVKPIVFVMPVEGAVTKEYTDSTVVFSKTLGYYTGHMGVDISAEEGASVCAAYDGIIESVTESYLDGTVITIDHGKDLKTVYSSLIPVEGLAAGVTVTKGQVIGTVSTTNLREYKDGAHLHFEVLSSGGNIDPMTYLLTADK